MKITRMVSIADIFTLINALLGFGAILLALDGHLDLAVYAILIGILCDGLDGLVARRFSRKWYLGDYLDVMADTTSFCVAPSVVIFLTTRRWMAEAAGSWSDAVLFAACGSLVVAGLLRLARFCYLSGRGSSVFIGLPSPGSALLLSLLAMQGMFSDTPLPAWLSLVAVLALAILMISDLKYPKVRGAFAIASGLVISLMILTRRIDATHLLSEFLLDVALMLALAYIALGPFAVSWRTRRGEHG